MFNIPSNSFRVRLAISLISMRDNDSECGDEMSVVGGTMVGAGVVSTLLTSGDLRGLSMLRPTRLQRGILNMCLHEASPKRGKGRKTKRAAGEVRRKRKRRHKRESQFKRNFKGGTLIKRWV